MERRAIGGRENLRDRPRIVLCAFENRRQEDRPAMIAVNGHAESGRDVELHCVRMDQGLVSAFDSSQMDVLCPPQWQRHDRRRQDQDQRETGRLSHTSLI
jgi:hypothetical protein